MGIEWLLASPLVCMSVSVSISYKEGSFEYPQYMFWLEYMINDFQLLQALIWGAQKNRLIETVLLTTHNICLGREIR